MNLTFATRICENESLQREVDQTRLESQEYISYQSKRHQRLQSLMTNSNDHHSHKDLTRQGEEHQERTNELMRQLAEKEEELVRLDVELCGLSQFKSVEQHNLSRVNQLKAEQPSLQLHHRDVLRGLEAHWLSERERCEGQARHTFHVAEVSLSQQSDNEQLLEANKQMIEELQQLIEKARVLRARQVLSLPCPTLT
ncbi:hypothetical protein N1851_030402 [Merluccius polli]|uniref:Uncharacterized protein n=1 Tax=Merluccius polli TaxID=89951 RepID=A0AA47M5I2_MERPO|nr:hypothetical protein N1851_030402 [Merluccius polli]